MFRKFLLLQLAILLSLPSFSQQQDSVQINQKLSFTKGQLYVPGILMASGIFTTVFFKDQIKFKIRDGRNQANSSVSYQTGQLSWNMHLCRLLMVWMFLV